MKMDETGIEIGIDIGGTFTDIVCRRPGEPDTILSFRRPGLTLVMPSLMQSSNWHPITHRTLLGALFTARLWRLTQYWSVKALKQVC